MFQNYLAAALRNLLRNKIYTAINVLGLAVGFAAAIFATLFVRDQGSSNSGIPGSDRIYVVATTHAYKEGVPPEENFAAYRDVAAWLAQDFPEVEATARYWAGPGAADTVGGVGAVIRHGDIIEMESNAITVATDPGFFSVLPVPNVAGNAQTALDRPDGVVITRKIAQKYFGRDTPIGEVIEINQHPMRVAAVIEDWPLNTFSAFGRDEMPEIFASALARFSTLKKWDEKRFGPATPSYEMFGFDSKTLVRLKPNASIDALQKAMPQFVDQHIPKELLGNVSMRLIPLVGYELASINNPRAINARSQAMAAMHGAESTGLLIVLAAAINFVNGMTARASRRAVEVGVRKITGAARRQLIQQFLGESVLYVLLGLVVAIGLVTVFRPAFHSLIGRVIAVDPLRDPALSLGILGGVLVLGGLAGLYPAFILGSLRPAKVLKAGNVQADGSNHVRQGLVTLQFAILIGLVVLAISIYRQTNYAINEAYRYDKDQILEIWNGCATLKVEIRKLPGVRTAGCGFPLFMRYTNTNMIAPDGSRRTISYVTTDIDQFEVYGIKPVAGRFFSSEHEEDIAPANSAVNPNIVINEAMAGSLGFSSPAMAIGQEISWQRDRPGMNIDTMPFSPSLIIGVVPDVIREVQEAVSPTIYYADPAFYANDQRAGYLNVKLTGNNIPETVKSIDRLWGQLGTAGRPIHRFFLDDFIEKLYGELTQQEQVTAVFCGIALFIAMLGLFGLSAFTAERRTKEIGVRKAMGAGRIDILRLLLWEFSKPILWANVIAWPLAYFVAQRWLDGFPNRVDLPLWIFAGATFFALIIAVLTVAGHALLITRTQPASALRYE